MVITILILCVDLARAMMQPTCPLPHAATPDHQPALLLLVFFLFFLPLFLLTVPTIMTLD
jgi:hypothetical protein